MPGSLNLGKLFVRDWFRRQQDIKSIIDFGAGLGTYRRLLGPGYHWTAVEIFQPYVTEYELERLYDEVILGDLRTLDWPEADCLIFGDVLEHLTKQDVSAVIERTKAYKHMIVSLPIGPWPQGAVDGNEAERHLSTWEFEECRQLLACPINILHGEIGVFIR
jgi:hypothetical protein